jgi:hypothetical protein
LAILAQHAPDQALPLQARLDAARTAYDSWDARTQTETAVALLVFSPESDRSPVTSAARTGSPCAMAALFQFGLLPSQSVFYDVATEATAEALLDALAATESQGEAVDAATRRQRTAAHILRTLSITLITGAAKCVLVSKAGPDVQAKTVARMRFCGSRLNPALSLRLAHATIKAAQGTEATAVALDTLVADELWQLLSESVHSARVCQAQLLADKGADVFATKDKKSLLCASHLGRRRPSKREVAPPLADPIVAAAAATGEFASADAARAHAAAAAAEEERLFAAVHGDPEVIKRSRVHPFESCTWAGSMNSVLGVRWVWQRMCERDSERARTYLQPSANRLSLCDPISVAIDDHNVRCVRFFASLGARMAAANAADLAKSCLDGDGEFSWALLDALPDDAVERARILEAVTPQGKHTAVAGVALAVLDGHRFSPALAEALLAAGATVPRMLLFALCDPSAQDRPVTSLPGELARALRWTLEHFQRTHSSCVV